MFGRGKAKGEVKSKPTKKKPKQDDDTITASDIEAMRARLFPPGLPVEERWRFLRDESTQEVEEKITRLRELRLSKQPQGA
jgi:hypothetical protein